MESVHIDQPVSGVSLTIRVLFFAVLSIGLSFGMGNAVMWSLPLGNFFYLEAIPIALGVLVLAQIILLCVGWYGLGAIRFRLTYWCFGLAYALTALWYSAVFLLSSFRPF